MPLSDIDIDWDTQNDYTFEYEVGLAPELSIKISKKDKLNYYNIKADDKLINNYSDGYC